MALSIDHYGSLFPQDHRLVLTQQINQRIGHLGTKYGLKAAKTFFRFTLAFRSRQSVCQQTLSAALGKTWYTMFDEW